MQPRIDQEPLTAQLWRRRAWLAPGLLVALIAVVVTNFRIQLLPPALERDSAEFAAARTEVLVDFRGRSVLADLELYTGFLTERANFYARVAASPAILELIGREAGLNPSEIDATGPYNPDAERLLREPTADRRAIQLSGERQKYRLRFDTETNQVVPIVQIYAQAPTVPTAKRLADAAAIGLRKYVQRIQDKQGLNDDASVHLRQLGAANGAIVNPGVDRQIAVLVFLAAFFAWSVLVLLTSNLRRWLAHRAQSFAAARPTPEIGPRGARGAQQDSLDEVDLTKTSFDDPYVRSSR